MKKVLILCIALCCAIFKSAAQDTEFWFVAPDASDKLCCDHPVFLVISNPTENPATVEIRINGGTLVGGAPINIPAGQAEKITWNTDTEVRTLIENPLSAAGTVTNKGIQIKVTHGEGVMAYYEMDGQGSKDLFSLKGKHALGNEFYIPMMYDDHYPIMWEAYAQVDIVAAENCQIQFTPTKDCMNTGGAFYPANTPSPLIPLAKGETFKLIENVAAAIEPKGSGLAGTKITSDTPNSIAVTVTEDAAFSNWAADIIGDQIVPTAYTGTRYVVVKGHTTASTTDRLYFTASTGPTTVTVYGDGGWPTQTVTLSGAGNTKMVDISHVGNAPDVVYVESSAPVYCYHVSGTGNELGSALIPSMFSITQHQLAFYASDMSGNGADINEILLVFRDTCENYFEISNGGPYVQLSSLTPVAVNPIPGPVSGSITWRWAKITLPAGYRNDNMISIRNTESPFSLGYFNGDDGTSSYGYISGFGDWSLPDTLWRCTDSNVRFRLTGGYALSYDWAFPNGTISNDVSITLRDTGRYTIDMDVDYKHILDTVYLYEITLDPQIKRIPNKPPKVGVPQDFMAVSNSNISNAQYYWTFEGGTPATSTLSNPRVIWNSIGEKRVTLTVQIKTGSGIMESVCEKTVTEDLIVRPKNNGYFVDQNVSGGQYDGSSWQNAFLRVEDALKLASQGDYIWVAKGEYAPPTDNTYLIDYDSIQIYGGFGAWEANLNERDFAAHPTILNGRNNSVVTFDGKNAYTNGSCGVSTAAVLDGFIIQNGTNTNGAGILFTNGASGTISNCIIRNNQASLNGGGIYIGSNYQGCLAGNREPVFFNLEISGNLAIKGAGIYNDGSSFKATNITVSGNYAASIGGLYNNDGDPTIRNSIIWGNRDNTEENEPMDIIATAGTPIYTYSILGGSNGSGTNWNIALGTDAGKNTDVNPLFSRSGFNDNQSMREGNYKLTAASKATNTGRNVFVLSDNRLLRSITLLTPVDTGFVGYIPNDLNGNSRIEYDVVDRGAYEYYPNGNDHTTVYEVFIPVVENVTTEPETGLYWVRGHDSFVLTLYPKNGSDLKNIEITTGSKWQDEWGAMKVVYNEDGSVTVTFRGVTDPLNIQINGVSSVSNDLIDSSYAIWSNNGYLQVRTTKAGTLKIYTLAGAILKQLEVSEGEISIPLSQGVYIVTFNEGSQQKIVVK